MCLAFLRPAFLVAQTEHGPLAWSESSEAPCFQTRSQAWQAMAPACSLLTVVAKLPSTPRSGHVSNATLPCTFVNVRYTVVMTDDCSPCAASYTDVLCLDLQYLLDRSNQQTRATVSNICEYAACLLCYQALHCYHDHQPELPCAAALGLHIGDRFVGRNARRTDSIKFPRFVATIQGRVKPWPHV